MRGHDVRYRAFFILWILSTAVAVAASGQNLRVTLLGTGSPQPRMDRFGPGILVEAGDKKLLFDCGRGVTQRIEQIRIRFTEIDALFLTHLHSDHVVGIPDLWLTGWARGRKIPLQVWGPAGTKEMMSHLKEAFQFDIQIRQEDDKLPARGVNVLARDIEQGVVYDNAGIKVTAFAVDHGQVKPALGYRVDFEGHSVVLSGDTRYSDNLIHFSQGTDVLIHEVIDPEAFRAANPSVSEERFRAIAGHHTTAEQAGTIFSRVKPKLAVYSHIVPGDTTGLLPLTRKTYSGPLEVGEDLMTVEIGEKVVVHRPATVK
ncbi:MAG TPA: MBL fold metallo-hydrolase [Candidatus Sulfotelmatobacter sp.]|nr:MBL fold metallo-hydrolase [Candidatus Sulfotelmatobacter sp.]